MPTVPILMPQLGESIAEATIIRLGIAVGDAVRTDQEIIEVETNKAVMGVTTLCDGIVAEIRAVEGVSYSVGSLLGLLEVTEQEVTRTGVDTLESLEGKRFAASHSSHSDQAEANLHFALDDDAYEEAPAVVPSVKGLPVPTGVMGAHYISPRMRARMDDLGVASDSHRSGFSRRMASSGWRAFGCLGQQRQYDSCPFRPRPHPNVSVENRSCGHAPHRKPPIDPNLYLHEGAVRVHRFGPVSASASSGDCAY